MKHAEGRLLIGPQVTNLPHKARKTKSRLCASCARELEIVCLGEAVFLGFPIGEAGDFGWLKTSDWDGWVEAFDDALHGDQDFSAGSIQVIRHQDSFAGDQENFGSNVNALIREEHSERGDLARERVHCQGMHLWIRRDSVSVGGHPIETVDVRGWQRANGRVQAALHVLEQILSGITIVRGNDEAVIAKDQDVRLGVEARTDFLAEDEAGMNIRDPFPSQSREAMAQRCGGVLPDCPGDGAD